MFYAIQIIVHKSTVNNHQALYKIDVAKRRADAYSTNVHFQITSCIFSFKTTSFTNEQIVDFRVYDYN